VNSQIDLVAEQLAIIPELANGFDAVGFSQGTVTFCTLMEINLIKE
jgi:hypothetical protein